MLWSRGGRDGAAYHEEDVVDIVHHDVHSCQLGPDLSEETDVGTAATR